MFEIAKSNTNSHKNLNFERELSSISKDIKKNAENIQSLKDDLENFVSQKDLSNFADIVVSKFKEKNNVIDNFNKNLESQSKNISKVNEETNNQKNQLSDIEKTLSNISKQLSSFEKFCNESEKNEKKQEEKLKEISAYLDSFSKNINNNKKEIEKVSDFSKNLNSDFEKFDNLASSKIDEISGNVKKLEKESNSQVKAFEKFNSNVEKIEGNISKEFDKVREEISEGDSFSTTLKQEIEELKEFVNHSGNFVPRTEFEKFKEELVNAANAPVESNKDFVLREEFDDKFNYVENMSQNSKKNNEDEITRFYNEIKELRNELESLKGHSRVFEETTKEELNHLEKETEEIQTFEEKRKKSGIGNWLKVFFSEEDNVSEPQQKVSEEISKSEELNSDEKKD